MTMNEQKLQEFCDLITAQRRERLIKEGCTYEIHRENYTAHYHMGSKFVRVDVGGSGKYMVELLTGQIYGIKGYGVVHRGHCFGTLDTINDWNWSGYRAFKKLDRLKARYDFSAPALDKDDLFAAGIADIRKGDSLRWYLHFIGRAIASRDRAAAPDQPNPKARREMMRFWARLAMTTCGGLRGSTAALCG